MSSLVRGWRGGPALFLLTRGLAVGGGALALAGVVSPAASAGLLLPLAATIATGVVCSGSGIFGHPVRGTTGARDELALTFDDGPDPQWTPRVLDTLDAHGHRATFFLIGARAARHPELVREIVRRGHEVANHTWRHSYLTPFVAPERLATELRRTSTLLAELTGTRPRWFRPPVGLLSPRVVEGARRAALDLVTWTATARDGVARTTVDRALRRLRPHVRPGAILVLHDVAPAGARAPIVLDVLLPLLDRCRRSGLRSVCLSQLTSPVTPDLERD